MAAEYGEDAGVFGTVGAAASRPFAGMDTAKVAGLLVVGALGLLALMRRSFGGVNIRIGD